MKLNKEKFMKTEMGGELEETIRTWDKAIDERRKRSTEKDGAGSGSDGRSHYRRRRCTWICRGIQETEREPEPIQKSNGDAGPERKTESWKR